jgi:hypothetical protein
MLSGADFARSIIKNDETFKTLDGNPRSHIATIASQYGQAHAQQMGPTERQRKLILAGPRFSRRVL